MKKVTAQVLAVMGIITFVGSLYMIYQILIYAKQVNSGPNPPGDVILYYNAPICGCNLTHGLVWNVFAVIMTLGVIVTIAGLAKYRLIARKGITS